MMSQRETALTFIEELRRRKSVLKEHINKLSMEIVELDIQIRDIRQNLPIEQEIEKPTVKHIRTEQEIIADYETKIAELKKEIERLNKHV